MKNKLCSSLLCEYGQCPGSPTCVILTYYVQSSGQRTSSSQRIYLKQNKLLLFLKLFKWKTMFDNVLALTHKCRYAHTHTHTPTHRYVCTSIHPSADGEIRGQLVGVESLFPPCGYWRANGPLSLAARALSTEQSCKVQKHNFILPNNWGDTET